MGIEPTPKLVSFFSGVSGKNTPKTKAEVVTTTQGDEKRERSCSDAPAAEAENGGKMSLRDVSVPHSAERQTDRDQSVLQEQTSSVSRFSGRRGNYSWPQTNEEEGREIFGGAFKRQGR